MAKGERFFDNSLAFLSMDNGICNRCINVSDDGATCKAFPKGIPSGILKGKPRHLKPVAGQIGFFIFEKRKINS